MKLLDRTILRDLKEKVSSTDYIGAKVYFEIRGFIWEKRNP